MKKYLRGAAAALAVAAPGVAAAQSGYADLSYQSSEADIAGIEADGEGYSLGGAYAWGGDGSVGIQADAVVTDVDEATAWTVGGHLFSRNTNHLIGGFVNYGNVDSDAGAEFGYWTVGVEGQWYLNRTTFDGALSYSEGDDDLDDVNLTAVDLGVTQFITDNFSLGGGLGFGNIEVPGGDADVSTYGVGGEYQFTAAPISIFGGWQHAEVDDIDSDSDTLSVGVRYNLGGTLLERNRAGASLARGGGLGRFGGLL